MILSLVTLALALVALLAALVGWGSALERLWGWPAEAPGGSLFEKALLGIAFVAGLALALNLVVPLTPAVNAVVFAGGLAAGALQRRALWSAVSGRAPTVALTLGVLALAYVAGAAARGSEYDTGLYHLPALLWGRESAAPFGLVHLHSRLGFGSAWFAFAGALWLPGLGVKGPFLANALLFLVFVGRLGELACSRTRAAAPFAALLLGLMTLPPEAAFAWQLGAPSTDAPAAVFVCWCVAGCLASGPARRDVRLRALASAFMAALLAVMTKPMTAPVLVLPLALAALDPGVRRAARSHGLRRLVLPPATLAVLWGVRSLVLSGCVVYPISLTCVPGLPWGASRASADELARIVRNWARLPFTPADAADGWTWLGPWLDRSVRDAVLAVLLAVAAAGTLLVLVGVARSGRRHAMRAVAPFGPTLRLCFAGLAVWFVSAPDVRFGLGFLVSGAVALAAAGLGALRLRVDWPWWARRWHVLCLAALATQGFAALERLRARGRLGWPDIRPARVHREKTAQGREVWVVDRGSDQCWATTPPCTPSFDPGLQQGEWLWRPAFWSGPARDSAGGAGRGSAPAAD